MNSNNTLSERRADTRAASRSTQNGGVVTSLLGWLMFIFLLVVPLIKSFPLFNEYLTIKRAVQEARLAAIDAEEFEGAVVRLLGADQLQTLGTDNLDFTHSESGAKQVGFAYTREVQLYGPVSLKIRISGTAD